MEKEEMFLEIIANYKDFFSKSKLLHDWFLLHLYYRKKITNKWIALAYPDCLMEGILLISNVSSIAYGNSFCLWEGCISNQNQESLSYVQKIQYSY